MTTGGELERSEVEAALETRRELGLQYDAELVDGFADRIRAEVERRVGAETSSRQGQHAAHASAGPRQLALAWTGIGAINLAHALQSRQRGREFSRG